MSSEPTGRPRWTPGDRNGQPPRRRGRIYGFAVKLGWIGLLAFAINQFINLRVTHDPDPQAKTQVQPATNVQTVPPGSPESIQNVELATAASEQRQKLAEAKFKQRQVVATFDDTRRALDEWEQELRPWEQLAPPLMKSDDGRRIASDETLVKRYRLLVEHERLTRQDLTTARKLAEELIWPVREALNNSEDALIPSEGIAKELREIRTKASDARDELRSAREQMKALLSQASDSKDKRTLEEAIADQREGEAKTRSVLIEAEVKKADEEGNRKVAEAQAEAARLKKQLEADRIREEAEAAKAAARLGVQRIRNETERAKAKAEREAEEKKALAVKQQLEQRARGDEVRRYLGVFMAMGYSQPAGFTGNKRALSRKVGSEGPISYSAIKGTGALGQGRDGLERLAQIGSASTTWGNDRPSWGFNGDATYWDRETFQFVQKAQDLLNELGPTMVELKLLAP